MKDALLANFTKKPKDHLRPRMIVCATVRFF